jgi:hypothetical protein
MSFLVILRPARAEMPFEPTEEESRIVGEHYEYLVSLRDQGKLVVAADPAVTSGVMTAEIRPLRIAVR